jgi:chromosome segregation ATPase
MVVWLHARGFVVRGWVTALAVVLCASACTGAVHDGSPEGSFGEPSELPDSLQGGDDSPTSAQRLQFRVNELRANMLLAQAALADSAAASAQAELARLQGDVAQSEEWMTQSEELIARAEQLQQAMTGQLDTLERDLSAVVQEYNAKALRNQNDPTPAAIADLQALIGNLRNELESLRRQLVP